MWSERHETTAKLALFALRTCGLVVSAWILSGLLADAHFDVGRPRLIDMGIILLPSWLAVVWGWPPLRRPGWFFLAGTIVALIVSWRFGTRLYEMDTDMSPGDARRRGFEDAMLPSMVGVALATGALLRLRYWLSGLGASPEEYPDCDDAEDVRGRRMFTSWDGFLVFAVWAGAPAALLAVVALLRHRTPLFASWGLLGVPGLAIGLWLIFNTAPRRRDVGRPGR